jgi:GNAT superfamily N-acetyltransferase
VVELAATVADDWQGIGLGSALLAELMRRARDEGHSAFRAYVLAINGRSIAMLRRAGFRGRPGTGTLREHELALGGAGSERLSAFGGRRPPSCAARASPSARAARRK